MGPYGLGVRRSQPMSCTHHTQANRKGKHDFSFLQAGYGPHSTPSHTLSLWSDTCSPNTIPDQEFLVEQLVNKKFLSRLHSPFLSVIYS
jgi:hypothetical protein